MLTVQFKFLASTKGAHRYVEMDSQGNELKMNEAQIGALYVRKSAMPDAPKVLTVTVE